MADEMPRLIQKNVVLTPAVYFSARGKPVALVETSVVGIVLCDMQEFSCKVWPPDK